MNKVSRDKAIKILATNGFTIPAMSTLKTCESSKIQVHSVISRDYRVYGDRYTYKVVYESPPDTLVSTNILDDWRRLNLVIPDGSFDKRTSDQTLIIPRGGLIVEAFRKDRKKSDKYYSKEYNLVSSGSSSYNSMCSPHIYEIVLFWRYSLDFSDPVLGDVSWGVRGRKSSQPVDPISGLFIKKKSEENNKEKK